jgi:hypothetical protein
MGSSAKRYPRNMWTTVAVGAVVVAVVGGAVAAPASASNRALLPTVTTTTLLSSANPSVVGDAVTFTATVTDALGIPVGSVAFLDGGSALSTPSLVGGTASYTTSTLTAGSHSITAQFLPDLALDPTLVGSVSAILTQVVNTATGGGGGGGGVGGLCLPGQTTPTPTISAPTAIVGRRAVIVRGVGVAKDKVDLYQRSYGQSAYSIVATMTAATGGTYAFTRTLSKNTSFATRDEGVCGNAYSSQVATTVAIDPLLTLTSPRPGRLKMRVSTSPVAGGQTARFYRLTNVGTRKLMSTVRTGTNGVAKKVLKVRAGKYRVLVTVSPPGGNLPGQSKPATYRVS